MAQQKRVIRHRIEYTKNKHSRAVYRGETIVIRLAKNLSKIEEKEHIQNLLRRMTHMVLEEKEKTVINPFRHLLQGGQSTTVRLSSGKIYQIQLHPASRTRVLKTAKGFTVEVGPSVRRASLHRSLWNALASAEHTRIEALVHRINKETYNVHIKSVRFSFAQTQWGSCSPQGVIMLNAALLFVPPSVLKYVIVHELAHRIHANHSDKYWAVVEDGMPSYKRPYKMLQDYRLPQL